MPSLFPGMDPYLEAPDIWPDLHDALAGEIRAALNNSLPAPYYARLEMRPEVGIVDEGAIRAASSPTWLSSVSRGREPVVGLQCLKPLGPRPPNRSPSRSAQSQSATNLWRSATPLAAINSS